MAEQVKMVPVSRLRESPDNPRRLFGDMNEFAETIRQQGILQPIVARETSDGPEIVMGHRRARAAKIAGLKEVPVIIRQMSRQQALEQMIVENNEREDVNALEQAEGYAKLMTDFGMTADQVAERVGVSRALVYQATGLLELSEPVKKALLQGKITPSHAVEIAKVRASERLQFQALSDVMKMAKGGEPAPVRAVRRMIQDRYLSAAPKKHGNSKHQQEVREHGAEVALRRRVVARLIVRVVELIERRAHLDDVDLRAAIVALAETQGEAAREVFQRRGIRVDRLGKVVGAQLRSLLIELTLAPWLSLDDAGEYSSAVRATSKAYGLSLSEMSASVEATGAAEALFEKS